MREGEATLARLCCEYLLSEHRARVWLSLTSATIAICRRRRLPGLSFYRSATTSRTHTHHPHPPPTPTTHHPHPPPTPTHLPAGPAAAP